MLADRVHRFAAYCNKQCWQAL